MKNTHSPSLLKIAEPAPELQHALHGGRHIESIPALPSALD